MSRYVDIFKLFLFTKVKMRLKMITTAPTPSGLTCPGCQGKNENDKLDLQAFIFREIITSFKCLDQFRPFSNISWDSL